MNREVCAAALGSLKERPDDTATSGRSFRLPSAKTRRKRTGKSGSKSNQSVIRFNQLYRARTVKLSCRHRQRAYFMARTNRKNQSPVSTPTQAAGSAPVIGAVPPKMPPWWSALGGGQRVAVAAVLLLLILGVAGAGLKYLDDSAKREWRANLSVSNFERAEPSLLSKVNPFTEAPPPPSATPQLSKEYIYAGSRMLAVEDAGANAAPPADLAVWRPDSGFWYVLGGQGSAQTSFQWGGSDDEAVPGDYDGDGKTDFAVWRHSNGTWYISPSSSGGASYTATQFGIGTANDRDKPVPADYDGDGKTDIAVFRPSTAYWYLLPSSSTGVPVGYKFGLGGDRPAPADYDGDGKADLTVWRDGAHSFYSAPSGGGATRTIALPGVSGDEVVSGDYDGDGRADAAIKNGNAWSFNYSATGQVGSLVFGLSSDVAVPNDYDGDGRVDIALWRSSGGNWYIRQSARSGQPDELRQEHWGQTGDTPVPAFYRR